jgi:16S rRNA (cytosine967-C5)-methyltransferase
MGVPASGGLRVSPNLVAKAQSALAELLEFSSPADQVLSRFFRSRPSLGRQERGFIAEASFAVLRRKRSLEAAAGSPAPASLLGAALVKVLGLSGRSLDGVVDAGLLARVRAWRPQDAPEAVRADLPDWLWQRLLEQQGVDESMRLARGLLNAAALDLRVNLARTDREAVLEQLRNEGIEAVATPFSPAGIRLAGKPAINRHALFEAGLVEVQDEGSQLLAWLLGPRRSEMVADYCAGAGGKTLAMAMLMRGTGRLYAMDVSAKRLAALGPRAARAGISSIHTVVLSGDNDARVKRLAGKLDRVLVDAPCSGFGTLRRNPDLKWRHQEQAIGELADKQLRILRSAARLVKPGGRLVYATCSILREENDAVADAFMAAETGFREQSCAELFAGQKIALDTGGRLRLSPHVHGTDGFFAAAFHRG